MLKREKPSTNDDPYDSQASGNAPKEFGGMPGVLGFMVTAHILVYYLWISSTYYRGAILHPASVGDVLPFLGRLLGYISRGAVPTGFAVLLYFGFLAVQFIFAVVMPGLKVRGLPVALEGNRRRVYSCNGLASWYATLALAFLLHVTNVLPITVFADNVGPMLTTAMVFADLFALIAYLTTVRMGRQVRMSGSVVYDFFTGASLNPRIGRVDLKLFCIGRVSYFLLCLFTISAAVKYINVYGHVSWPLIFMAVAQGLYANAIAKGEESLPASWEIFHEKYGWMMIFWNLVAIPWMYSFNSYYLLANGTITHSTVFLIFLFVVLLGAYYVWDTANSQKDHYRMQESGTYVRRLAFPQLPWGTLRNPRFLATANGGTLLTDGWWGLGRKINYTADVIMAILWGLVCGFGSVLPYLYPAFLAGVLLHRAARDEHRCQRKYGPDWDRYKSLVPKKFIPFVY